MTKKKQKTNGTVKETIKKTTGYRTKKKVTLSARSENQKDLFKSIKNNIITIATGPPGTGKTMISVVSALESFFKCQHGKIIFTRPCIEADGENLGFLPGDLNEKIAPYMMPIFDFLSDYMDKSQIERMIFDGKMVTLPLAFMRGATFRNAFVLLDECVEGYSKTSAIINGVKYKKINIKSIKKAFERNEDIQILSYNVEKNIFEYRKMNHFFDNGVKKIINICLNNKRKKPLKTTSNHPFAVFNDGRIIWKNAGKLKKGDLLIRDCREKNSSALLSSENYDILIGLLLGDGSLSINSSKQKSYRLGKTHGLQQYEYMSFCKDLFDSVEKYDLKSGYTGKPLCGFKTKSLCISRKLIDALYSNNKKKIIDKKYIEKYFTDRSLALWYMDDGSMYHTKNYPYIKLHTEGFSFEENLILKSILDNRYSVDARINKYRRGDKEYCFLRFNKDDSNKLFSIINPYIVPTMYYKLPNEMQGNFSINLYDVADNFRDLSVSQICSIENGEKEPVYNMEIDGNNNYFIDKILVHNCQNTTPKQMKMFLTRIGEGSKVVMTGDPHQSDIRGANGLTDIVTRLEGVPNIGIVRFNEEDVVRHEIIKIIEKKYEGV